MSDRQGRNKQTALDFYDLMFNQCRTADAIEKYAGTTSSRTAGRPMEAGVHDAAVHSKSTGAQEAAEFKRPAVINAPHRVGRKSGESGMTSSVRDGGRRQERTWRCGPTLPRPR